MDDCVTEQVNIFNYLGCEMRSNYRYDLLTEISKIHNISVTILRILERKMTWDSNGWIETLTETILRVRSNGDKILCFQRKDIY